MSHLVGADLLVLLTDTSGVFTADPRVDEGASLIEEIVEVDTALEAVAGGAGTARGSGGMASKLAAAKIAAWSGVRAVIADAREPGVVRGAIEGTGRHGRAAPTVEAVASQTVDRVRARDVGPDRRRRRRPPRPRRRRPVAPSCRRAGVEGQFDRDDAVEVVDATGRIFAKGLAGIDAATLRRLPGRATADLPDGVPHEVVHRDDLVLLP